MFLNQHICLSNRKHSPEVRTAGTYSKISIYSTKVSAKQLLYIFFEKMVSSAWPSVHKMSPMILKSEPTESIVPY